MSVSHPDETAPRVEINPEYLLAYNWLTTRVYNRPEQMDKAIEASKKILALNPDHAVTYANLAYLYLQKKMPDTAIENGIRAIKLKPDLQFAHSVLGYAYFNRRSYTEARTALLESVRLNARDAKANFTLARVHEELGDRTDAIRQWERYLSIGSLPPADAEFANQRLKALRAMQQC